MKSLPLSFLRCTSSIWVCYGIQQEDVAIVRTKLLLRSLIVDSDPFQEILNSCFNYSTSHSHQRFVCSLSSRSLWSELYPRLLGVNRLFRMISDVTSPAFNVEGRQWRSSVIEIFYHYFTALWADATVRAQFLIQYFTTWIKFQEEVRLSVQSSSAALLPAHLEIISQCWDESLSKAPIVERVRLISFLIQLRPRFPSWKGTLWKYFQFKVISDVNCPQFCLGMLLSRLSWNMMMILMMVAACVLLG